MNIYIVVEGDISEKTVYKEWIPFVNSSLSSVNTITDVTKDNFFIVSGGGYPNYFEVIENGIVDISSIVTDDGNLLFDRLVISVDSEDYTMREKSDELEQHIKAILKREKLKIDYRLIIQHFCLETWLLGNKRIVGNSIQDPRLKKYIKHFNVSTRDPEHLMPLPQDTSTRAQHAELYLRLLLQEKYRNLTYQKSRPHVVSKQSYFKQLNRRFHDTNHIASFESFLSAFI